jgi:hypothetical protein
MINSAVMTYLAFQYQPHLSSSHWLHGQATSCYITVIGMSDQWSETPITVIGASDQLIL